MPASPSPAPRAAPARADATAGRLELVHQGIEVLGRLAELFRQRRQQLAEEAGLTDPQWEVLEEISSEHFMPTMFARRRDSSAAAVSKLIRQLVDKGLVTVRVARGDARHREYALTPRGRRTMEALRASREQAIEKVWLAFESAELAGFARFGNALADRLAELAESTTTSRGPAAASTRKGRGRRKSTDAPAGDSPAPLGKGAPSGSAGAEK